MSASGIGDKEEEEIRALIVRIINDIGNPEPPVPLDHVRDLLNLDLKYYSATDPSMLLSISHRIKLGGKRLIDKGAEVLNVLSKAKLSGIWLPDNNRILIEENVPQPKQRFIEAHEIVHSLTPWHRETLLGDNEFTLSPACHAQIEAEANYGAGKLLFLMDKFVDDARDVQLNWKNIKSLKGRYGNTLTTTLWHTIEERDPDHPVLGIISKHPKHDDIGGGKNGENCSHFIKSRGFRLRFPHVTSEDIYEIVRKYVGYQRGGPVGDGSAQLIDANGQVYEFVFESFSNTYDVLTYGTAIKKSQIII